MATYLISYHGGSGPPTSPEAAQQTMAAFQAWVASVGDSMVDPGAPLGAARTVSSSGVTDGGGGPEGYSVIRADDLNAAVVLVKGHPFIARGGAGRRGCRRSLAWSFVTDMTAFAAFLGG
jgi:hypothetical protein